MNSLKIVQYNRWKWVLQTDSFSSLGLIMNSPDNQLVNLKELFHLLDSVSKIVK